MDAVRDAEVDVVMAAIVGAAGLPSTLAAASAGKRVLLANKESLVVGGALLVSAARKAGATLIPIDSEHNAIFQCMPTGTSTGVPAAGVRRILLTASGGPFLRMPRAEMARVTPDEACAHPRWRMGRKISVDSATLMNKGLELIEACVLFGMEPRQVEVVVHPQSIVHSMVEYVDGSVLAQLGNPDMRTPIAHALGWPDRIASGVESLDLVAAARLDFEAPDVERFPALRLARSAAEAGGTARRRSTPPTRSRSRHFSPGGSASQAFRQSIEAVLDRHQCRQVDDLQDVLAADRWARQEAESMLTRAASSRHMTILTYVLAFLVAIGVLVAVHEYGHFWMARRLGIRVLRFSIGFGRPLWRHGSRTARSTRSRRSRLAAT